MLFTLTAHAKVAIYILTFYFIFIQISNLFIKKEAVEISFIVSNKKCILRNHMNFPTALMFLQSVSCHFIFRIPRSTFCIPHSTFYSLHSANCARKSYQRYLHVRYNDKQRYWHTTDFSVKFCLHKRFIILYLTLPGSNVCRALKKTSILEKEECISVVKRSLQIYGKRLYFLIQ